MNTLIRSILPVLLLALSSTFVLAQPAKLTPFDVTNYVIDATLVPSERRLNANVDVTFTPLEATRSISFELNGSLKIDTITRVGGARMPASTRPATTGVAAVSFVQDQSGASAL